VRAVRDRPDDTRPGDRLGRERNASNLQQQAADLTVCGAGRPRVRLPTDPRAFSGSIAATAPGPRGFRCLAAAATIRFVTIEFSNFLNTAPTSAPSCSALSLHCDV